MKKLATNLCSIVMVLVMAAGCASTKANLKPGLNASDEEKKAIALGLFKEGAELLFNDNQAALERFKQAIELDSSLIPAYFNAGVAQEAMGDLASAAQSYEACLAKQKDQASCLENLVIAKFKLGDQEGVQKLLDSYMAEFPEAVFVDVAMASFGYIKNDLALAEKYARRAIERDADTIQALYVMARIFYERKQYAAAKWVAKNTLEMAPSHGGLHLLLGHTYVALDLLADALDSYAAAVKYLPSEEALESYGLILLKRGRVKESLVNLEKLVALRPLESRNYLHVGNAYMANKQFDQSKAAYLKALELNSQDKDISFNLGLLFFDFKPKDLPEMDRLKTSQAYFKAYLDQAGLKKDRIAEVNDYLKTLGQKIEMLEYEAQSAKEAAEEPEPEPEPAAEPEPEPEPAAVEEKPQEEKPTPEPVPVEEKKPEKSKPKEEDIFDEEEEFFEDL